MDAGLLNLSSKAQFWDGLLRACVPGSSSLVPALRCPALALGAGRLGCILQAPSGLSPELADGRVGRGRSGCALTLTPPSLAVE